MIQSLQSDASATTAAQHAAERQEITKRTVRQFEETLKLMQTLPSSLVADYEEQWRRHQAAHQGLMLRYFRDEDAAIISLMRLWSQELTEFVDAVQAITCVATDFFGRSIPASHAIIYNS